MSSIRRTTSIVAAVGASALGVGLIGLGTGVGANFTASGHANANIATGTFGCVLSSDAPGASVSGNTVTIDLGTINSSAASSKEVPVTVTNSGSIPLVTSWSETTTGNISGPGHITAVPVAGSVQLGPGTAQTVSIGFSWTALDNSDLGRSGTAQYTVNCNDVANSTAGFELFQQSGGEASWNGTAAVLTIPSGATAPVAAGVTILNPGSALPTSAPTFVTDSYAAGAPRLAIKLSNGKYVFGYPLQAGMGSSNWETSQLVGHYATGTWNDVQSLASGLSVVNAFLVYDNSGGTGVTANISCINYSGSALFGSC